MSAHFYKISTRRLLRVPFVPSKTIAIPTRRLYHGNNTTDFSEGAHHLNANNELTELLNHLESTKVSDPRTVSY